MKLKKGIIIALLCSTLSISLTGCGSTDNSNSENNKESNTESNTEQSSNSNESKTVNKQEGSYTLVLDKKGINISQTQGPIKFTINNIVVSTFKPNDSFKDNYDGKEDLVFIQMDISLSNTSDKTIDVVPIGSKIVLDDKTQYKTDSLHSTMDISKLKANEEIPEKLAFYIPQKEVPTHFKLFCRGPVYFSENDGAKEYGNFNIDINLK